MEAVRFEKQIDLEEEESQEQKTNGKSLIVDKAFEWSTKGWKPLIKEDLKKFSIADFLNEEIRVLISLNHNDQCYYLVSHDGDVESIQKKYKNGIVIHLRNVIQALMKYFSSDFPPNWPQILLCLKTFPGSKIIND